MPSIVAWLSMGKKMKIHVGVGAYRLVLNVDMTDERLYREAGVDMTDERLYREAGIHVGEVYDDLALRYPQKSPEELWMLAAYAMTVECGKVLLDASETPLVSTANDCIDEIDRFMEDNGF